MAIRAPDGANNQMQKNMHVDHRFGWHSVTVSVMLFVNYEN